MFQGFGRAKVAPIHINIDHKVKSVQQNRRPMAFHYAERLKGHQEKLKKKGIISGQLGPK